MEIGESMPLAPGPRQGRLRRAASCTASDHNPYAPLPRAGFAALRP